MTVQAKLELLITAQDKAERSLEQLRKRITALQKGMTGFGNSADAAKKKMEELRQTGDNLVTMGRNLVAVGAGLAATAFFPIKAAATFEKSMSGVLAVTTDAEREFDALSRKAAELGRTTKFSASEAADGMRFLGQAGFTAQEVIKTIGPSLELAAAGGLDLASAADIASNILSAMRLPVEELGHVVDVLANTASSANTDITQMAEAMAYVGPAAAAAKVPLEEVAAAIGILGDNGIQASSAGTQLRGIMVSLSDPTKKARNAMDKLGVTIARNADGSINLTETMKRLGEANMGLAAAAAIFRRTSSAAALAMSVSIKKLTELTVANHVAAGAAKTMALVMEENLIGSFTLFKSALDGLLTALGKPLLGVLSKVMHTISSFLSLLADLANEFPLIAGLITGLVGGLGLLVISLGAVALAVGSLQKAFAFLVAEMGFTFLIQGTGAFQAFGLVIGALKAKLIVFALGAVAVVKTALVGLWALILAHPFFAIAAAVGVVIAAFTILGKSTDEQIEAQGKITAKVNDSADAFLSFKKALAIAGDNSALFGTTALKLRDNLIAVADATEGSLGVAASNATASINSITGELKDGGKALEEYETALRRTQFDEGAASAELLAKKLREVSEDGTGAGKTIGTVGDKLAQVKLAIMGSKGEIAAYWDEFKNRPEAAQAAINRFAADFVRQGVKMGNINLTDNVDDFIKLISSFPGLADLADPLKKAFVEMREEVKRAGGEVGNLNKPLMDVEEGLKSFEKQAVKSYKEAMKAAEQYKKSAERLGEVIASFNLDTETSIQKYKRRTMSDTEQHASREKEIARLTTQARKLAADKDYKIAQEYYNKVQNLIMEQADEVKSDTGMILIPVEVTTAKAIEQYKKIREEILANVLEPQKKAAEEGALAFETAANKIMAKWDEMSKKLGDVKVRVTIEEFEKAMSEITELHKSLEKKDLKAVIAFTGTASSEKPLIEKLDEIQKKYDAFTDSVTAKPLKINVDGKVVTKTFEEIENKLDEMERGAEVEIDIAVDGEDDLKNVGRLIDDLPDEREIGVVAVVRGEDDVENLQELILSLLDKSVDVVAETTGMSKIKELKNLIRTIPKTTTSRINVILRPSNIITTLQKLKREISALRSKTITITTKYRTTGKPSGLRTGGPLSDGRDISNGGRTGPGYGGGDKIPFLGEAGEFMIRKEAVKRYGMGFFDMLNRMAVSAGQFPGLMRLKEGGPLAPAFNLPEIRVPALAMAPAPARSPSVEIPELKNMGVMKLRVDGSEYPVAGNTDVLSALGVALKRKGLASGRKR